MQEDEPGREDEPVQGHEPDREDREHELGREHESEREHELHEGRLFWPSWPTDPEPPVIDGELHAASQSLPCDLAGQLRT